MVRKVIRILLGGIHISSVKYLIECSVWGEWWERSEVGAGELERSLE
jgi:hypothetical protein